MQAFFFGLGFSSQASARAIRERDRSALVSGTVRSPEKANLLADRYHQVLQFDGTRETPAIAEALVSASHVIQSIAPDDNGDPVLRFFRDDLAAAPDLKWLCYYSTVGVYGDFGGDWIDETAPLVPRNMRSDRRVLAEQEWRDFATTRGVPLTILRLAGIYGPGRSTFDKLREGTARRVIKPGQVFNRIHVEDIARVTALAAEARLDGTFNLADDEPAPPQDVIEYGAKMINMPVPQDLPYETAEMTPMQRSFYRDNKRVSNRAIKTALGIDLLYPDYRAGLRQILESEQ
ncbi:NAD-dependent epimerase/dehydratase family protein [Devosia sediminis]|uniref:NAD-dependent epimerase/dehydratase family protein n=1 Tax=Devosia sediminis TaxID=2798801 RepID=A0A934IZW8_9HYPH|nr:NAD-dependent epimerase/dehydratase family protein [Devosia sediminis]MBJ3785758.1 NAD-dependent epimerase/dehydratase family protein [Devosia sediminis]